VRTSFRPAGGSFGEAVPLSNAGPGQFASSPEVAFDGQGNALVLWLFFDGTNSLVQAAFRPAGGSFGAPQTISATGQSASAIDFALDGQGNALAVWSRSDGANRRTEAAFRPAGGSFGAAAPISAAGGDANLPQVAFDGAGNAIAVWLRYDGANHRAQAAFRPAGGSFGAAQTVSPAGETAGTPQIAFDGSGNALMAWEHHFWVWVSSRPPGGTFDTPGTRISPIDHNAIGPQIAFDGQGNALAVWYDQDATSTRTAAAVRPAGGSFGPSQPISDTGVEQLSPRVAFDGQGNAAAVWRRFDGTVWRAEAAGYDTVAPVLSNLRFPTGGRAERALPFSATAFDVWGPVTTTWAFGDGTAANGSQVAHTYSRPGSFGARVTATDAAGYATSASQSLSIGPERNRPRLTALKLSPKRFRAARRGPAVAAATGTRITYRLSEPARVRFRVQRATVGRRVGRSCRRTTAKNRGRKRCKRYVAVRGSFTHRGKQGKNRLRFMGRLRNRSLAAGRYRLAARATDKAGNRSKQRRTGFRVRRSRR
jgi:hypothetical protein